LTINGSPDLLAVLREVRKRRRDEMRWNGGREEGNERGSRGEKGESGCTLIARVP